MEKLAVIFVSVVTATLLLATPRLASACRLSVDAEPRVVARWPDLPERVRSAFEGRDDIDACARVKVALRTRFHVEVTLPDGRVAERVVPDVEDVVPVLEALLVVPESKARTSEADVEAEPSVETPPVFASPPTVVVAPSEAPAAADGGAVQRDTGGDDRRIRLELSASAGARTGGGPVGLGLGLLGFADVSGWLAGLGGRADRYTSIDASMTGIELAALGGRRIRWGETVAVDLVAGPALLLLRTGDDREEVARRANGPHEPALEDPITSVRVVATARLHFGMRSAFRTFVGIDAEVGPSTVGPPSRGLPVAMLGVALGVTVGAR